MSYALIGDPIKNQLASQLLETAFQEAGIQGDIQLTDLDPVDAAALANFCYESDLNEIKGMLVQAPYQSAVMDYLDYYDPMAKQLGFANILKNEEANLNGYNSMVTGLLKAAQEAMTLPGKKILILGDQLLAQAAIYGFGEFGMEVFIWSSHRETAKQLAKTYEIDFIDFRSIEAGAFDLVIHTTTIGAGPQMEQSLLTAEQIGKKCVVMETVLDPLETALIKETKKTGAKTISADRLVLHEVAGAFEVWFEKPAPLEAMEAVLKE